MPFRQIPEVSGAEHREEFLANNFGIAQPDVERDHRVDIADNGIAHRFFKLAKIAGLGSKVGPNQTIERGQFRVSKSFGKQAGDG